MALTALLLIFILILVAAFAFYCGARRPAVSAERFRIQRMREEGKLSAQEASDLLSALGPGLAQYLLDVKVRVAWGESFSRMPCIWQVTLLGAFLASVLGCAGMSKRDMDAFVHGSINMAVAAEARGERPSAGFQTWPSYWSWRCRLWQKYPDTAQADINYLLEARRRAGLPPLSMNE